MSLIKRLSIVDKAAITATGNSTCICGSSSEVLINTSDMVKPDGTPTRDWTQAGSTAILSMPLHSTVLYAELIWCSTVAATFPGSVDVRSIADNPITVIMPNGDVKYITPDNGQDFITFATSETVRFRSADVTSLIGSYLGGSYTVSNIPTSIPPQGLNNTRCGWSLNVVFRNDSLPPKKIDLMSGIGFSTSTVPYQTIISGFTTYSNPSYLKGQMVLTATNGLPLSGTETLSIGPSFANLKTIGNPVGVPNSNPLTAPNNPYNNFFAAQVNVCDTLSPNMGLINITGTNGVNNSNAFVPTQVVGARNKWDMTAIDISDTLVTDQTQLAFQLISGSYSVQLMSIGTQINAVAPDMTAVLTGYNEGGDNQNVVVGERMIYAISIANNGVVAANNVTVSFNPGSYASILPGSLKINGTNNSGDMKSGVNIGAIGPYGVTKISFEMSIDALPPLNMNTGLNTITSKADYSYQFISGVNTITNNASSNLKTINVEQGSMSIVKSSSILTPSVGNTVVYTNVITNTGTQTLNNIMFQDADTDYTTFIPNSVYINNVLTTGLDPAIGFPLSNLSAGDIVNIQYSVTIDSVPPSGSINTNSAAKYSYLVTAGSNSIYATTKSNLLTLPVQFSQIVKTTCPNNDYPNIGDTVTYTTNLINVGNVNAVNVFVQDTPIVGSSFIDGTVTVNQTPVPGANPYTGFTLSSAILSGSGAIVKYDVKVNSLPPKESIENTSQVPFQYKITDEQGTASSNINSNTVETLSNYVCMSMSETASKACAAINDVIYYTVNVSNTGNINAVNTLFTSNIHSSSVFVNGSVTVNGVSYPSYNPINGFSIGTICAGNTVQIVFAVTVSSVPAGNNLYNQSNLAYSYNPNPAGSSLNGTITSNTVTTAISKASYTATLSVDKLYAVVGDTLVFTSYLNNTGTTILSNVRFFDNLSANFKFTSGTVYINGTNYPSYDPTAGFNIPDVIHPSDSVKVVFVVQVMASSQAVYTINTASFNLTYQACSDTPAVTTTVTTNEVRIFIINGQLTVVKSSNKNYAALNDIITYNVNIANTGNSVLQGVLFSDAVDPSLQFVAGSVIVNNINKPEYNPNTGFPLGTMNVGQTITISFQAAVINVPVPNVVYNFATGTYTFAINPAQTPITQSTNSNTVSTIINASNLTFTKQVDKLYAAVGETLSYTLIAKNTGTVTLTNINLTDILQSNLQFAAGTVTINGVSYSSYNPNNGFAVPDIQANGTTTIVFQAKVMTMPSDNKVLNNAAMTYSYTLIPGGMTYNGSITSNTVTTVINNISVTNVKTVDLAYATANSILTYTSTITNNSTVSIGNTNFIDVIPTGTSFVPGSVIIGGVSYPSYNPQSGFTLGTLTAGQNVVVVFQVQVAQMPSVSVINNQSNLIYSYAIDPTKPDLIYSNTLSNIVTTMIRIGADSITKSADRTSARINDIVTYTVKISNTGNTPLLNLIFKDTIQSDSLFVENSVYVDGIQQSGVNPNTGFSLPNLDIGGYTTVQFKVQIISIPALNGKLNNTANANYQYYVDPNGQLIPGSDTSNTTTVNVLDTIVSAAKTVDQAAAKIGDTINYTVVVTNQGNVPVTNVNFIDVLDSNLQFVAQSVYIGNTQYASYNPNTGFALPNISENGGSVTVKFAAVIKTRPSNNIIFNSASITYQYTISGITYNGTMQTNTVNTTVLYGELTITKAVNKTYADINDIINYNVIVRNTGSVNAANMTFIDTIQSDASFISGSVTIDNVSYPSYNPNTGFPLADLAPGQAYLVGFSVKVISLPANGKILNSANTTFTYQLSASDTPVTITAASNTVTTFVYQGNLTVAKSVDKTYAAIGDNITYTINVTNSGNTLVSNVFFSDIVQLNADFVPQSVTINNEPYIAYNPNTGFNLPDINSGETVKVVFKVQVNTLPTNQILYNSAAVSYQYTSNPASAPVIASTVSNTVQTIINVGSLNVVKSVDKAYATVGDTITYTVDITNSGTVNASAVNFRDVIKPGLTFAAGSVTINGTSYPSYNPYDSFTLGTLTPGQSVQVKFKADVISIPSPNVVSNTANVVFSYYINPNGNISTVQTDSNAVTTTINVGSISLTKSVDKSYAVAGEVLTYSFVLTNTGNVNLSNVIFIDNLQSNVTFNAGSVIVNGTPQAGYNPTTGFNLGSVATLAVVNISFTVTVIANPANSTVINFADGTFSYQIAPNGTVYTKTTQSNIVTTVLVLPSIQATKAVDLAYATIGDILNYTIIVKNTGNYLLTSVNLVDTLSNGGTFNSGSVYIDGVNYPTYNPVTGFALPNLIPGNTAKVQFTATVTLLPVPPVITNSALASAKCIITQTGTTIDVNSMTNTVTTNIAVGKLSNTKTVDKAYAIVGDTVTYTSTIANTGNVTATNVFFQDALESQLTFVPGSVMIGSVSYPSLNPVTGFSLSNLSAGASVTVIFQAVINSLPVPPVVSNTSIATFNYKIDPAGITYSGNSTSNSVTTNVVTGQLTSAKVVDKTIATLGDILTYTITITNTGNVAANGIVFTDTPTAGAAFQSGSVVVNGISEPSYNPTSGFPIPSIATGGVATVVFSAAVTSVPSSNRVNNTATVTFTYLVDPKQQPYSGTSTSNTVTTNISLSKLEVVKAVDKNYATIGDKLTYTITIKNVGNVNAVNVQFVDPTPANTVFVNGSVTVNGTSYPSYNPAVGFNLGTIVPGQTVTVIYNVQVTNACSNS